MENNMENKSENNVKEKMGNDIKNKKGRKPTVGDVFYWVLALVPFALSLVLYSRLPQQVPTHWASNGQIDGYSSRNMAAFGIPALLLGITVLLNIFYNIDPKRDNIMRSKEMRQVMRWFLVILAVVVQSVILLSGIGINIHIGLVMNILIAALFVAAGNYLPKCRQNYTMGIKLPWTLADEDNWTRTHRVAGYVWMAGGILMLVIGLIGLLTLYFTVMVCMILIPAVYSYWIYRKKLLDH